MINRAQKNNLQATHQSPPMPLAAAPLYKNYAFSRFDHKTMRKKTHQNELDGWKHDGWALASG